MLRTGKENSRGGPSNWVIIFLVYILSLSSFRGLEFSMNGEIIVPRCVKNENNAGNWSDRSEVWSD